MSTTCTISLATFNANAKPVMAKDALSAMFVRPLFADRKPDASDGWNLSGKTTMMVGSEPVTVQVSLNVTVIGSKPSASESAKKRYAQSGLTHEAFKAHAKGDLASTFCGGILLTPKVFEKGSFGWYGNGQVVVVVDGKNVECQFGCSLTVVGSAEAPRS